MYSTSVLNTNYLNQVKPTENAVIIELAWAFQTDSEGTSQKEGARASWNWKESREIKAAMQKTNPSPSQTLLGTTRFFWGGGLLQDSWQLSQHADMVEARG